MSGDDPSTPFEQMYAAAAGGGNALPWDRGGAHPLLQEWAADLDGGGRRALVPGSGLGSDAELLAQRGFDVVAFDFVATAIAMARERFADSRVDYRVADLLALPAQWRGAFDLVVESLTVQSLPVRYHAAATANVAGTVAPGGTLLVIATARDEAGGVPDGPPWPLTRDEVQAFAGEHLEAVRIERIQAPGLPDRWRAEFRASDHVLD